MHQWVVLSASAQAPFARLMDLVGHPELTQTPGKIRFPGLPMGAATAVVLEDLLGYRPEAVADLKRAGAI